MCDAVCKIPEAYNLLESVPMYKGRLVESKEWVSGPHMYHCFSHYIGLHTLMEPKYQWEWALVDGESIGMYTGVQDKHSNHVYSGDIIRRGFEEYVIIWNSYQCRFDMMTPSGSLQAGFNRDISEYIEVIGNIWDIPEWWKKEDNNDN